MMSMADYFVHFRSHKPDNWFTVHKLKWNMSTFICTLLYMQQKGHENGLEST